MKKSLLFLYLISSAFLAKSQSISNFEHFNLPIDSALNGSEGATFYSSGAAIFPIDYTDFGGFGAWQGFSVSTFTDLSDSSFANQYTSANGSGANNSKTYAVAFASYGENENFIKFTDSVQGVEILGVSINNSLWAAGEILKGGPFTKAFGGADGNDPDFFKLTFYGLDASENILDSVEFYLADYRFSDNSQDYVITDWTWVDLSALGKIHQLKTRLFSSDTGTFGMNTPAYYCLDSLVVRDIDLAISFVNRNSETIKFYPNPASDFIQFEWLDDHNEGIFEVYNLQGKLILKEQNRGNNHGFIDLSQFASGAYFIKYYNDNFSFTKSILKR